MRHAPRCLKILRGSSVSAPLLVGRSSCLVEFLCVDVTLSQVFVSFLSTPDTAGGGGACGGGQLHYDTVGKFIKSNRQLGPIKPTI